MILATVEWNGRRADGSLWRPIQGIRPQIRFDTIQELSGKGLLWDARIEAVHDYRPSDGFSRIEFSISDKAPIELIAPGALFSFSDGPKLIATGCVLAIGSGD